jgi:hypothetical protein
MQIFDLIGNGTVLHLEGELPAISAPYFAWNYQAQLRGHALQATLSIGDDDPARFIDYFEALAQDWRGWSDSRRYESLDGSLRIDATHDGVGSVSFHVTIRGDLPNAVDWSATQRLAVEPGQLAAIAAAARKFAT